MLGLCVSDAAQVMDITAVTVLNLQAFTCLSLPPAKVSQRCFPRWQGYYGIRGESVLLVEM